MDDGEVIELGEDGTFDIPAVVAAPKFTKINIVEEDSDDELVYPEPVVDNSFNTGVLDSLKPSEFKLFRKDKTLLLVLKLHVDEIVKSAKVIGNVMHFTTSASEEYKVEIPEDLKFLPQRMSCKVWNNVVSASLELL